MRQAFSISTHPIIVQQMSFVKSKLRLARGALDEKDYTKAKEAASEVLDYESSNYHA